MENVCRTNDAKLAQRYTTDVRPASTFPRHVSITIRGATRQHALGLKVCFTLFKGFPIQVRIYILR